MLFLVALSQCVFIVACSAPLQKESENLKKSHINPEQKNRQLTLDYITVLVEAANRGMTDTSSFNIFTSTIEQVISQWGEPDQTDQVGEGYYAIYKDKDTVFGYTAKGDIYDIRSNKKRLNRLSLSDLKKKIGEPAEIRVGNGEQIIVYNLSEDVQLKFIILNKTNRIDHLSIYHKVRGIQEKYALTIQGESNQLTNKQWETMQNWRREIVKFQDNNANVYINGRNEKKVSLTFDDGPDDIITPKIIEILQQYKVKGNFFFIGSEAEKHPQVVRNAYKNGNLVLSHSYHHVDLSGLDKNQQLEEITRAGNALQSIIGKEPAMIRPPYGETNETLMKNAELKGYSIIIWSIDTLDWSQMEAENIIRNVTNHLRNGDIILMHSDSEKTETAKALPKIIETIQERDFEIVGLDELLGIEAYQ
ncbi:polysaccharide deacetylase family protein [Niallia sp. FSL W8-0951]|uniref:polysaccharide deacetylase family protein n=1 Tax=Niallia TaxID=2837506 RepID=UPI0030F98F96